MFRTRLHQQLRVGAAGGCLGGSGEGFRFALQGLANMLVHRKLPPASAILPAVAGLKEVPVSMFPGCGASYIWQFKVPRHHICLALLSL